MPKSEQSQPEENSKSQRKRDMLALQKLGESLMALSPSQLAGFDIPENLLEAIQFAKSLTSNEAKRRQLQYVGKMMREIDIAPIKEGLKRLQFKQQSFNKQFHDVEACREKLITEGDDALNQFIIKHPDVDKQTLRQFIRNAQQDRKNNKNLGSEKSSLNF